MQPVSLGVAHWHVVGLEDAHVPADYVRSCADQARESGDPVGLTTLTGAGHFEIVLAESAVWPRVEERIRRVIGG